MDLLSRKDTAGLSHFVDGPRKAFFNLLYW